VSSLQHTATHCNTLQHTATHCNTLQHTATHCSTPKHTGVHTCTQVCHYRFSPSSFPPFEYRPLLTEHRALLIEPSQQLDSGCVIIEISPLVSLVFFSQCIGLFLVDHRALLIKLPRSLTEECELRPLLTEYGPLLIEYRALLTGYRPLLTGYRPLLTECRPYAYMYIYL